MYGWIMNLSTVHSGGPRAHEAESKFKSRITIRMGNSDQVH